MDCSAPVFPLFFFSFCRHLHQLQLQSLTEHPHKGPHLPMCGLSAVWWRCPSFCSENLNKQANQSVSDCIREAIHLHNCMPFNDMGNITVPLGYTAKVCWGNPLRPTSPTVIGIILSWECLREIIQNSLPHFLESLMQQLEKLFFHKRKPFCHFCKMCLRVI